MTRPAYVVRYRDYETGENVLVEPYVIGWRDFTLHVPVGFRWDGASVPHAVRSLIDDDDCGESPSLGHDFIYRRGGVFFPAEIDPCWRTVTRAEADRLFLDQMAAEGVSWRVRWPAYLAVRLLGRRAWRSANWL